MQKTKKGYILFSIIGFLGAFLWLAERKLAKDGNIIWNRNYTVKLLLLSLVLGIIAGCAVYWIMTVISQYAEKNVVLTAAEDQSRKWFLLSWGCIFLCWLPGYLAYYPAICSYDITIQINQIKDYAFNDHHPIFHTLLIKGAMDLGRWLGNVNAGIGLYAFFQMLLLSAALAAGIGILCRMSVKRGWLVVLLIYGCLFPFHMYMGISVTKDTIFSIFFLMQILFLTVALEKKRTGWKPDEAEWSYMVCTLLMILFRNNGKFAVVVFMVFLAAAAVFGKKQRRLYSRLLAQTAVAMILGIFLLNSVFTLTGAKQGDRREMLSVPIQQLARTMLYHGGVKAVEEDDDTLSEEDKALIDEFILNQAYLEYRPDIADPVKRNTNTSVVRYRTKDFLNTYMRLFLQYPGDYINAALAVNAGYLYPGDESHAVINKNDRDRGLGYIQTRWVEAELNPVGIYKESKWEWLHERLEEFADSNGYLRIPVLKYLMVLGSYLWFYLLLAACIVLKKRYRLLLPLGLVLGYYLTLFFGPTVQLRYLYPVMITLPFLALLTARTVQTVEEDS